MMQLIESGDDKTMNELRHRSNPSKCELIMKPSVTYKAIKFFKLGGKCFPTRIVIISVFSSFRTL